MNNELTYKLLKYLGQAILIYSLFKYVPKDPMSSKDTLLITLIVILSYAVFENFHTLYFKEDEKISPTQCNTQCAIKENMTNSKSFEHLENTPPISSVEETKTIEDPLFIQAQKLEKTREQELSNIDVTKSPNSGVYANPEIIVKGIKRNPDGSYTIIPDDNTPTLIEKKANSLNVNPSKPDENKMPYNYTDYNSLPVPTTWNTYEVGSSFLPPAQWFPVPPHPPVCVTDKQCPVCPVFTEGTNISLKQWDESRRISAPNNINTKYIEENLNK